MQNWTEGIQKALQYMEEHICEPMTVEEIAAQAYVSGFYFQRIFSVLCGISVGEYIRNRRLSLAAEELSGREQKVIDVALKYGYDSPDSFAKAFQRFHGISPSQAKEAGAVIKAYAPLKVILTLEGGAKLDYRIEEKEAFRVVGVAKRFHPDNSQQEIPKWWEEHLEQGEKRVVCGEFGICCGLADGEAFEYLIADSSSSLKEIPEGCVVRQFPAGTWAVFPCTQATLQNTNDRMWREWLPNCKEYKLAGNYNVERYTPGVYCELWLPVEKAGQEGNT